MALRHFARACAAVAALVAISACGGSPSSPSSARTAAGRPHRRRRRLRTRAPRCRRDSSAAARHHRRSCACSSRCTGRRASRIVLDSKPVVANIDGYCDKVGFGDWKFCDTRPEGNPERVACDYLVTGRAEDTDRWGPTWYFGNDLCSYFPASCANHPTEQFMVIAKASGTYEACASDKWPVAPGGRAAARSTCSSSVERGGGQATSSTSNAQKRVLPVNPDSSRARRNAATVASSSATGTTVNTRLEAPGWTRSPALSPERPLPRAACSTVKPRGARRSRARRPAPPRNRSRS